MTIKGFGAKAGSPRTNSILTRQQENLIAEKRRMIDETLWAIHEADIGVLFETYEAAKTDKDGELETNATGKMLTVRKAAQTSVRSAARPSQGDRAYTGKRSRQRCASALFRLQANAE